ncbi:unnamed protein product, partial [Amoebophrya sp. A25]|eukprot:GSA25T00020930001.1
MLEKNYLEKFFQPFVLREIGFYFTPNQMSISSMLEAFARCEISPGVASRRQLGLPHQGRNIPRCHEESLLFVHYWASVDKQDLILEDQDATTSALHSGMQKFRDAGLAIVVTSRADGTGEEGHVLDCGKLRQIVTRIMAEDGAMNQEFWTSVANAIPQQVENITLKEFSDALHQWLLQDQMLEDDREPRNGEDAATRTAQPVAGTDTEDELLLQHNG